jgi:hypothetical protein
VDAAAAAASSCMDDLACQLEAMVKWEVVAECTDFAAGSVVYDVHTCAALRIWILQGWLL